MKIIFLLSLLFCLPLTAGIEIRGGTNFNTIISNGDTTPRTTDGTDFGDVTVPGSKTVSFQVKATGNLETIVSITEDGAAWDISSGGGFGNLSPGSTRTFNVRMSPTAAGYKAATVTIATGSGLYTFKVEGNALGEPEIVVRGQLFAGQPFVNISDGDSSPTPTDGTSFGSRGVSEGSLSHTFQIENTGTAQIEIDSITDDSSEFSISGAPSTVGVGQTQTFLVKFNPTSFGTKTATITIQNNDANEDPFTFEVNGIGEASKIKVLGGSSQSINIAAGDTTPRTLDNTDFGTVVAGSGTVTKVFKIENTGNEDLFVTAVSEDANAFSITGAPGPLNPIAPGGSNNFNIILDADVAGTKYGTVTILSNDPDNGAFTFDITAEATGDPEIVVRGRLNHLTSFTNISTGDTSPTTVDGTDFGSQGVPDGYIEHTFEIENTGNAKLNIESITDDSNAFVVVDVPSSVAVGNTQTFGIRFNPGSSGQKTATITIDNDDPDGNEDPFTFEVTGLGLFGKAEIYGGTNFGELIANNDDTPSVVDGTDFGSVNAGIGTVSKTFRIKNDGNDTLTILGISESGSAFSISAQPSMPAAIAPNGTRDFTILFAPTAAGNKSATVTVLTSDTVLGRDNYTFDIIGEANGVAEYSVAGRQNSLLSYQTIPNGDTTPSIPDGTDFGPKGVSDGGVTRTFEIENTGSAQLVIDSIVELSPHFSVSNVPSTVGVNQTKTFTVTFNPTSSGNKSTTINITTNAEGEESYSFKVTGEGTAPELLVEGGPTGGRGTIANGSTDPVSGAHNNFGEIEAGTSRTRTFQITNIGNEQATITAIAEDGNAWSLTGGSLVSLPAGGTHDFTVTLAPTSAGPKAATVTILSNDPAGPYTFEVTGTATGESDIDVFGSIVGVPTSGLVPDGSTGGSTGNGTSFGDQGVADGGISHSFEIFNKGNAKLTISSIQELSPHFSISGAPSSVGVGQTATFTITFNPTSQGTKETEVTITSDAPGDKAIYTFVVVGTGEAPDIAIKGGTNFGTNIPNADITPSGLDGTDFGNVNADSTVVTRTFQIENSGNENLSILSALSDNNDFTLAGVPSPLTPIPPGGTNEFTIAFDPANTGFSSATISIQSNDPDESPFTFLVEGFGTDDSPEIAVIGEEGDLLENDPQSFNASTDFGDVEVGGPAKSKTFTIENRGTGTLTVTSISEDGARYQITNPPTGPVEPGESLEFEVVFSPNAATTFLATVTIVSDDPNESPFRFDVSGTGTTAVVPAEPEIKVNGGQALNVNIGNGDTTPRVFDGTDLGSIVVGESKNRTFRIENTGDADLTISQVILVGAPGAITSFPSVVTAGSTADFTVTVAPQLAGPQTRTLRILSNDGDESTFTFDLTATGVAPLNPLSIENFQVIGENLELTFISDPAKTYQIAYSFDLETWNSPGGLGGLQGDINEQTYLITGVVNSSNPKVFLRVEEE
ncbi:choice-of-anchor D domain-containing protein [Roseibacillus persicicus]|uniref:choice-of-anchor D domain-containing protein n=1 Tax=Roseibacillus persicicus TaxID=454148 RepID=UPI00398B2489